VTERRTIAFARHLSANIAAVSANTVETQWRGGPWPKGYSPNPSGRPKAALDVQALAREHTAAAIETLVQALKDPRLKVQAAEALLNRGWGKPLQPLRDENGDTNTVLHLTAAHAVSRELVLELASGPATSAVQPTQPKVIDLALIPPPTE
jgi:hypothetical protein